MRIISGDDNGVVKVYQSETQKLLFKLGEQLDSNRVLSMEYLSAKNDVSLPPDTRLKTT